MTPSWIADARDAAELAIWKYELQVTDEQVVEMPLGARVLAVQVQYGKPCLWAEVVPAAKKQSRRFITHGTGHPYKPRAQQYVGSYQLEDGLMVFHVFEDLELKKEKKA